MLRAQFELPGFSAAMTRYLLGQALELCALAAKQGPTVVVIDGIADRYAVRTGTQGIGNARR